MSLRTLSNTIVSGGNFFKFVYDDAVYAQTWEILTLKNCIEPP